MSKFNTTKWFRNQYIRETTGENPTDTLETKIMAAINEVDENLSYKDLAKALSNILKNEYGAHNFTPFVEELISNLKGS